MDLLNSKFGISVDDKKSSDGESKNNNETSSNSSANTAQLDEPIDIGVEVGGLDVNIDSSSSDTTSKKIKDLIENDADRSSGRRTKDITNQQRKSGRHQHDSNEANERRIDNNTNNNNSVNNGNDNGNTSGRTQNSRGTDSLVLENSSRNNTISNERSSISNVGAGHDNINASQGDINGNVTTGIMNSQSRGISQLNSGNDLSSNINDNNNNNSNNNSSNININNPNNSNSNNNNHNTAMNTAVSSSSNNSSSKNSGSTSSQSHMGLMSSVSSTSNDSSSSGEMMMKARMESDIRQNKEQDQNQNENVHVKKDPNDLKGIRPIRKKWKDYEDIAFVKTILENAELLTYVEYFKPMKNFWIRIAQILNEKYGYVRNFRQCHDRFKVLYAKALRLDDSLSSDHNHANSTSSMGNSTFSFLNDASTSGTPQRLGTSITDALSRQTPQNISQSIPPMSGNNLNQNTNLFTSNIASAPNYYGSVYDHKARYHQDDGLRSLPLPLKHLLIKLRKTITFYNGNIIFKKATENKDNNQINLNINRIPDYDGESKTDTPNTNNSKIAKGNSGKSNYLSPTIGDEPNEMPDQRTSSLGDLQLQNSSSSSGNTGATPANYNFNGSNPTPSQFNMGLPNLLQQNPNPMAYAPVSNGSQLQFSSTSSSNTTGSQSQVSSFYPPQFGYSANANSNINVQTKIPNQIPLATNTQVAMPPFPQQSQKMPIFGENNRAGNDNQLQTTKPPADNEKSNMDNMYQSMYTVISTLREQIDQLRNQISDLNSRYEEQSKMLSTLYAIIQQPLMPPSSETSSSSSTSFSSTFLDHQLQNSQNNQNNMMFSNQQQNSNPNMGTNNQQTSKRQPAQQNQQGSELPLPKQSINTNTSPQQYNQPTSIQQPHYQMTQNKHQSGRKLPNLPQPKLPQSLPQLGNSTVLPQPQNFNDKP